MILRCTDAHCHADFSWLENRAAELSDMFICVDACFGCDWKKLADFSLFPIKKAFGLHPDLRISEFDDASLAEDVALNFQLPSLESFLLRADAIGETGLDYSIAERVPIELQKKVFCAQLALADKYGKPLVVHCVDAWGDLFDNLQDWSLRPWRNDTAQKRFMLHAAKCSPEMAERFAKIGAYFSFGARELNSKRGMSTAEKVPLDRILVESDSLPSRQNLEQTFALFGKIRQMSELDLSECVYKNYSEFFSG